MTISIGVQVDWTKMGGALWTLELMQGLREAHPAAELVTNVPNNPIFPVTSWMRENLIIPQGRHELANISLDFAFKNPIANSPYGFTANEHVDLSVPGLRGGELMHVLKAWFKDMSEVLPQPVSAVSRIDFMDVGTDVRQAFEQRRDWQKFSQRFGKTAVVIVNSEDPRNKDIPIQKWGDIARHLINEGYGVILTGRTDDRHIHFAATKMGLNRNVMNWVSSSRHSKLSVNELFVLLEKADVVLSPDTGPAKIAARLGTPVVELYRNTPEAVYGAQGPHVKTLEASLAPEFIALDAMHMHKRKQELQLNPSLAKSGRLIY